MELSTRAWTRSFETNRMKRVPTYYQDLIDVIYSNPGHVIASTACLGGWLPHSILSSNDPCNNVQIKDWLQSMTKLFGKDNFYLEM